jgi:hypothetical protein
MGATPVIFSSVDHSGEVSRTKIYVEELDNENFDDLFLAVTGSVTLLQAAYLTLTACNHNRTVYQFVPDVGPGGCPATPTAQREVAIRVSYRDNVTGKAYRFDVPGPVAGLYPGEGTDEVPLDNIVAAPFIIVFEANALSEVGNPVTVTHIELVGRYN